MRRSLDVVRSFKKYVALALPAYEVRLSSEEGAWERPFARVAWTTPSVLTMHGARQVESRRTLQIVCWPLEAQTPDGAILAAEEVVETLTLAFAKGIHSASYNNATGRAHPLRIPIYDYSDVDEVGAVTEDDRAATDFASLAEPPNVGDIPDPNTDLSRLIVADLRVRWMRNVAVPIDGSLVQTVPLSGNPSGP
jgi:hypothetical protein